MLAINIISESGFQADLKDYSSENRNWSPRVAHSIVIVPVIRTRVYADRISRGFVGDPARDNGSSEVRARVRAVSLPIV